jgi:hypothetical protein
MAMQLSRAKTERSAERFSHARNGWWWWLTVGAFCLLMCDLASARFGEMRRDGFVTGLRRARSEVCGFMVVLCVVDVVFDAQRYTCSA